MSVVLYNPDDDSSGLERLSEGIDASPNLVTQKEAEEDARVNVVQTSSLDVEEDEAVNFGGAQQRVSSFARRRLSRRSRQGRPSLHRAEPLMVDSIFSAVKRSSAFEELRDNTFGASRGNLMGLGPVSEEGGYSETAAHEESDIPNKKTSTEQANDGEKKPDLKGHLNRLVRRLFLIKFIFAFEFGFINGITFLLSTRFATMMSGNTLTLAHELVKIKSHGDELGPAAFTFCLILSYEVGAALFYFVWYEGDGWIADCIYFLRRCFGRREEETVSLDMLQDELDAIKQKVVLYFVMFVALTMGPLADILKFTTGCFKAEKEDGCKYSGLYYLCPIAFITGAVAGGYLTVHPTGVTTNMITGHLGKVSQLAMKIVSPSPDATKVDWDGLKLSTGIIICFFGGALVGFTIPKADHNFTHYHPIFTLFGLTLALLVKAFDTTYERLVHGLVESEKTA